MAVFRDGRGVVAHQVLRADGAGDLLAPGADVPLSASGLGKVLIAFDPGAGADRALSTAGEADFPHGN